MFPRILITSPPSFSFRRGTVSSPSKRSEPISNRSASRPVKLSSRATSMKTSRTRSRVLMAAWRRRRTARKPPCGSTDRPARTLLRPRTAARTASTRTHHHHHHQVPLPCTSCPASSTARSSRGRRGAAASRTRSTGSNSPPPLGKTRIHRLDPPTTSIFPFPSILKARIPIAASPTSMIHPFSRRFLRVVGCKSRETFAGMMLAKKRGQQKQKNPRTTLNSRPSSSDQVAVPNLGILKNASDPYPWIV